MRVYRHLFREALGHIPGNLKKGLLDVDVVLCASLKELDSKLIGERLAPCSIDNLLVHHVTLVPDEDLESSGDGRLSGEVSNHLGGPLTRAESETFTAFFKPAVCTPSSPEGKGADSKRPRGERFPWCSGRAARAGLAMYLVDVVGSMLLNLPDPVSDVVEALLVRHIVDQENPHRPAVIGCRDRPETLLSSRVPDLKLQPLSLLLNCANLEINPNGRDERRCKRVV